MRAYDILIPLLDNSTTDSKVGIFAQYDLEVRCMVVSGGYFKKLTKSEHDDCVFVAGRFCTTLTHLVVAEHTESCLFSLYSEHDENIQKYCSI